MDGRERRKQLHGEAFDLRLTKRLLHVLEEQAKVEIDELHDEEHLGGIHDDLVHCDNVGMSYGEQDGHLPHHLERHAFVTLHVPRLLERRELHRLEGHHLARLAVACLVDLVEGASAHQSKILVPINRLEPLRVRDSHVMGTIVLFAKRVAIS